MENLDYNNELKEFNKILDIAQKISGLGSNRESDGFRMTWTCVLHTRICVMGNSIKMLAPKNYNPQKLFVEWDYSSMFTLTRNVMECYQTLFYLCVDEISNDERFARKKLFDIHDYYARLKLFSNLNENLEEPQVVDMLNKQLTDSAYFKTISEKKQQYFLKGDTAFFISREDIEEKMGNDKAYFKFLYKLFSSNTHSFPMGFYGMLNGERGTGTATPIEVNYSAWSLNIAGQYILSSANDMICLFPDINDKLTLVEKEILDSYVS